MNRINLIPFTLIILFSFVAILFTQENSVPKWYLEHDEFYEEFGDNIIIGMGQSKGRNTTLTEKAAFAAAQANAIQQIEVIITKLKGGVKTETSVELPANYCKVLKKYVSKDGTVYLALMVDREKVLVLNGIQE